jgi:predicted AAA+ superfamily ATPase
VETAFFKHVFTRFYADAPRFSYWKDAKRGEEVDLVAELPDRTVPFEVKYQDAEITSAKLKGMRLFLEKHKIEHGYVISRRWDDFRVLEVTSAIRGKESEKLSARVTLIPAPLACFWLS